MKKKKKQTTNNPNQQIWLTQPKHTTMPINFSDIDMPRLYLEIKSIEPIDSETLKFEINETLGEKPLFLYEKKDNNLLMQNSIGFVLKNEDKKLLIQFNSITYYDVFLKHPLYYNITTNNLNSIPCFVDWEWKFKEDTYADRLQKKLSQRKLIINGFYLHE